MLSKKTILKICTLFLLWMPVVFVLVLINTITENSLFSESSTVGSVLARYPYAFDFEAMFSVLFIVWGIFLWRAANDIENHKFFISFSGWALVTHGILFFVFALTFSTDTAHFIRDGFFWIALGVAHFYVLRE